MGMSSSSGSASSSLGSPGGLSTLAEINVTPLVDVMLVLLIIFMISAPLMQQGVQIDLPKANAGTLTEAPEQLVLVVNKSRQILINEKVIQQGSLRPRLEAIVAVALRHNLYILSDEMYEHLVYDAAKPTCVATLSKEAEARTITVAGFSKTYAMTGWRLGPTLAPRPIARASSERRPDDIERGDVCAIRRSQR